MGSVPQGTDSELRLMGIRGCPWAQHLSKKEGEWEHGGPRGR